MKRYRWKKTALLCAVLLGLHESVPENVIADAKVSQFQKQQLIIEEKNYEEGQAIVLYRSRIGEVKKSNWNGKFGAEIQVLDTCKFQGAQAKKQMRALGVSVSDGYCVSLVQAANWSTRELIQNLQATGEVLYAQPNYIRQAADQQSQTMEIPAGKEEEKGAANDYGKYLWGQENAGQFGGTAGMDIGLKEVDRKQYDTREKIVAVVDSGVDYENKELQGVMWNNPYQEQLKGAHGYDFVNKDADPMDDYGHGTHCAGIVAADGAGGCGVTGAANGTNVKIMALKFLDDKGYGDTYSAISAYHYIYRAQQLGANVIAVNNSWTGKVGEEYGDAILQEIIELVGANGAVSVCAAGNDGKDIDEKQEVSPACLDSDYILSVAAMTPEEEIATFSNYGAESVDLAAPGSNILSTVPFTVFQPSIYQEPTALCDFYEDFEQPLRYVTVDELATATGAGVYACKQDGSAMVTLNQCKEYYAEQAAGGKTSLKWSITNARMGESYMLYFPYEKRQSETVKYESFFYRVEQPEFSWSKYYAEEKYFPIQITVTDQKVADGKLNEERVIGSEYCIGNKNFWSQNSLEMNKRVIPKDVGRYALGIKLNIGMDGDYTFYLDEVGISGANVSAEQMGNYAYYNGTSMASPYVAAGVAIAKALYPKDSALESRNRVLSAVKPVEDLQGKVGSGGILALGHLSEPKPAILSAEVQDQTMRIQGTFLEGCREVTVNGVQVPILSQTGDTVCIPAQMDHTLEVALTNGRGTTTDTFFFVGGAESQAKAVTDVQEGITGAVTNGNQMYLVDDIGKVYVYPVENAAYYKDSANYVDTVGALPYLDMYAMGEAFDKERIFGSDYKTVVQYELRKMTDTVCMGRELYTVVCLDMGYARELALVKLNSSTGKWAKIADVPAVYKELTGVTMAAYDNRLYLIGGYDEEKKQTSKKVYGFSLDTKQWSGAQDLPEGKYKAKAVWTNGKLAVTLGGTGDQNPAASGSLYLFDGTTWVTGASLSNSRQISKTESGLPYYDAVVGTIDAGLVYAGICVEGLGNTFTYQYEKQCYEKMPVKFVSVTEQSNLFGATIGNQFYIFSGAYQNTSASEKSQMITSQVTGYENFGKGSIVLVTAISVEHTPYQVLQDKIYEEGYVMGTGSYVPGEFATIKVGANKDYFVKSWAIDGVQQSEMEVTMKVSKSQNIVSMEFGKYVTNVFLEDGELEAGKKITLEASCYPEDSQEQRIIWKSEDETIATVDENGVVTAKADAAGKTVKITATAMDRGTVSESCEIRIIEPRTTTVAVKSVKMSVAKKWVKAGKTRKIKATVTPAKATDRRLQWKSSRPVYATVTQKGVVKGRKKGIGHTVKITAMCKSNKKIKASVRIKIRK